jgi:hypothetical protein
MMPNPLHDKDHPIWKIGTILACTALVISVNFFNAKQFDADDYQRIAQTLGGMGGLMGLRSLVTRRRDDD